jgi:uncharacterized protein YecE (DUF72 family)
MYIGCAGWNVPRLHAEHFGEDGTHLERYAGTLPAVEINSSFYRPHKPSTYERWAGSVPEGFRFAVKVPRVITHNRRLKAGESDLCEFIEACTHLGPKLGPLLVQLPPSLPYDRQTVEAFFALLRLHFNGEVACEPRHVSWFAAEAENVLSSFNVARVAADPSIVPEASEPGGWLGLVYHRLHGSPRIYYSAYEAEYLRKIARRLVEAQANGARVWCIFDNTAEGAAAGDALAVLNMISG